MLWRKSWVFGATLRDMLGLSSGFSLEQATSSLESWATGELDGTINFLQTGATRIPPEAYPDRMHAWFCPGAFDIASNKWEDCSGNGNTATLSGSGLVELRSAEHGATSEVLALSGTTSSVIDFGPVIPNAFTVCSVTRYTGGTNGRILQGSKNWLHGHHGGDAGVAYYGGWKTSSGGNVSPNTNWVVMCGTNAGSQLKLANGVNVGTSNGGVGDLSLWVNGGEVSSQKSDFAIAEVVVWPRGLTDQEMRRVSQHLISGLNSQYLVIPLAEFALPNDDAVGVLEGDDGVRRVFFKPVPNDGSLPNVGNGLGASVLQINIMAPRSGNYQVRLTQRRGSEEVTNKKFDCRSSDMASEATDSFFICASDPRSSATNPDPGTPDQSSCKTYHYDQNSAHTFSLSQGGNSLWLVSREVCTLASEITAELGEPSPPPPPHPPSPPPPPPRFPECRIMCRLRRLRRRF